MSELPKIGIGYRVGMLEVVEPTAERKSGYTVWRCRCACGGEIALDTRTLQRGTKRDCGCVTKLPPGAVDLTGQRFGKLTVLEPTDARGYCGRIVWRCRCDCGNEALVSAGQLTGGYTKSCGCLERPPLKDLVGRRFGLLTVTAYAGKRGGMHQWQCRCDCGGEATVGQTRLQNGKTVSCGCVGSRVILDNLKLSGGTSITMLEYAQSHPHSPNSSSGYRGVYLQKKTGRWVAQITFKRKTTYLGTYATLEEAVRARKKGEERFADCIEAYYASQSQ